VRDLARGHAGSVVEVRKPANEVRHPIVGPGNPAGARSDRSDAVPGPALRATDRDGILANPGAAAPWAESAPRLRSGIAGRSRNDADPIVETCMIVTIAKVADFDRFMRTFSTEGVAKRREHGCRGAHVVRDPDDAGRVRTFFDWAQEDYERFLADPDVPAIARQLALREPPVKVEPVAHYDA
jgi:quinol monooxygenase YgiN